MRIEYNPVHRRLIVPWYDSEAVYLILLFLMFLAFLFGFIGVSVARENPAFREYQWVPMSLVGLSAAIIVRLTFRLVKRYLFRALR